MNQRTSATAAPAASATRSGGIGSRRPRTAAMRPATTAAISRSVTRLLRAGRAGGEGEAVVEEDDPGGDERGERPHAPDGDVLAQLGNHRRRHDERAVFHP